ncbi:hypothetical protein [Variovorax soli]|uniref:Uncharacterized protein n=1 Tax=Variovorax soli TaxID=376815 RepID=A0ABU1NLW1_9BURK|nr:hypothetical protein [Variovorax soli]MDR6539455.1 hypothetical protein [Variovorax soli]
MKRLATALPALWLFALHPLQAATLETRSYPAEITPLCGERVTDCEPFADAGTRNTGNWRN